jgi:hypothetical protein
VKFDFRVQIPFALLALLLAGGAAALALPAPSAAAACAGAAGAMIGLDMLARSRGAPSARHQIDRVLGQVDRSRKLVIYERDTGLFAYWYVELRGNEECDRARRYGRDLAVAVIEPDRGTNARETQRRLRDWLSDDVRHTDVAGYLGNGRYVIVMPEAGPEAAESAIARMKADGIATDAGVACYPMEGENFEQLYRAASTKLPPALRHAA